MQIHVGSTADILAALRCRSRVQATLLLMVLIGVSAAMSSTALAQPPPSASPAATTDATAPLPEWDRLSATQRALLIAPLRQRWNDDPDRRGGIYQHAQRWQSMTPEQRKSARKGKKRFDRMDPAQREQARALYDRMQGLPPAQRKALREQWKTMTPEQRHDWMRPDDATTR